MKKYLFCTLVMFLLCTIAQASNTSYGFAWNRNKIGASISQSRQNTPLYIYGGSGHKDFLGVINGSKSGQYSIWNALGTYGNKFQTNSIWNQYGQYGSQFSNYSPFNQFATEPPVIVDSNGNFYGYFTINQTLNNRATFSLAVIIYDNFELIREDVWAAYDQIF